VQRAAEGCSEAAAEFKIPTLSQKRDKDGAPQSKLIHEVEVENTSIFDVAILERLEKTAGSSTALGMIGCWGS
jgi:hypothetical protein